MPHLYTTYNDSLLLSLLSGGDDRAFTEIYNRYWDKLLFVAGIKCRDLGIAEEIVQDIFLDIWQRRTSLNVTGSLEAYLAVSVKYRVINAQAKMKRALEYQQSCAADREVGVDSAEQWLSFRELSHRLAKLVDKLPDRCRITYKLSREEGQSQKQIARQLHISEKAVEANLSRALKSLRVSLKHFLTGFYLLVFPFTI